jgi:hypothetical protein
MMMEIPWENVAISAAISARVDMRNRIHRDPVRILDLVAARTVVDQNHILIAPDADCHCGSMLDDIIDK